MATFSKQMMGKEVGDASVYAKPHTMSGKSGTGAKAMQDPNNIAANKMTRKTATPRVSAGDPGANDVKTSGIKVRGTGAATKGLMARGPMA
jgi:hypothetical protein|tara:strand:+ start:86 stop:358 length:273 start_codon:yes stop_codon:yes gene_type:complete